jgi:glyoxylase-like metal-dependent hydrolase (beta-lactamase superfamily II)
MRKIADGIYLIKSMVSNQYLIQDEEGFTLIDAGLPGNSRWIKKKMTADNLDYSAIKRILITHADGDHYGAANEIRTETKAEIWAGEIEAKAMEKGESSRELKPKGIVKMFYTMISKMIKSTPTPIDHILKSNEIQPFAGGLKVIATEGHTPGHLSFFSSKTGILYCGDTIQIKGHDTFPSVGANTWDEQLARKSYEMQMELRPRIICAGHGFLEK